MTDARPAGFKTLTSLSAAREQLRGAVTPHGRTEAVPLSRAPGRAVATTVAADRDVPHYDRAAMDGFAVRAADTFDASDRSPALLRVADGDGTDDEPTVTAGTAIAVHTGSELPDGADAVVKVEATRRVGGSAAGADADGQRGANVDPTDAGEIEVFEPVADGENVAPAGEDVTAGTTLFEPGHRVRTADLALLKTVGVDAVECYQRPSVGVVPTGGELVQRDPDPGQVVETNGMTVTEYVERWGGKPTYRDIVSDDEYALRAALQRDLTKDLVVTTGGSSVGERDRIAEVLDDLGEVLVHGVAVKPGHPFGFGAVEGTPVLMLPGYPVACLVNAVQFLRPAVKWSGHLPLSPHPTTTAALDRKIASEVGVRTFARVRLRTDGDETIERLRVDSSDDARDDGGDESAPGEPDDGDLPVAEPVHSSGAGVMSSVALADGWVVVPEGREGIPAGERVAVSDWEWSP